MSTSILYIPAPGDPHRILADGLCGAKCPTAFQVRTGRLDGTWQAGPISWEGAANPRALPLVWQGDVVPEAIDRLRRVVAEPALDAWEYPDPGVDVLPLIRGSRAHGDAWILATIAARELGGRVEVIA